jgi:HAD superfamily hydrolase (TIGR01509 family)
MQDLKALLFDVDGTLADTERDGHRVAFNAAFVEAGLDWRWSVPLYGELLAVTGGKERIRYFIDTYQPLVPAVADLEGFIAGLHRAKTRFYTQALDAGSIPLRPGVLRLLQESRAAGLRLAVATTTTPENVTALLRSSIGPESLDWFEVIAAGDVVPAKKPAPDIYLWALERLRLPPEVCVAFEDSAHGLRAARDAGIATVLITINDYTREQQFPDAALVLDGLGEPQVPFELLAGDAGTSGYVDLALLQRLRARVAG